MEFHSLNKSQPNQYEEIVYFSKSCIESFLEPLSGFEPGRGPPGLETQFPA